MFALFYLVFLIIVHLQQALTCLWIEAREGVLHCSSYCKVSARYTKEGKFDVVLECMDPIGGSLSKSKQQFPSHTKVWGREQVAVRLATALKLQYIGS